MYSGGEKAEGWEVEGGGGGEGDGEGWEVDDLEEDLVEETEEGGKEGSEEIAKYKVAARRANNNLNRITAEMKSITDNLTETASKVTFACLKKFYIGVIQILYLF